MDTNTALNIHQPSVEAYVSLVGYWVASYETAWRDYASAEISRDREAANAAMLRAHAAQREAVDHLASEVGRQAALAIEAGMIVAAARTSGVRSEVHTEHLRTPIHVHEFVTDYVKESI